MKPVDMALLRRAANERWPIPSEVREKAPKILMKIAETETTVIGVDRDGKAVEGSNARSQVAAIRTLAAMDQINQADDHLIDKNDRLDQGKATERFAVEPIVGEEAIRPPRQT